MDIYTKRFLWIIILLLGLVFLAAFILDLSGLHIGLALMIGYISALASPAKLFAAHENRMPNSMEYAKYPLFWAILFSSILTAAILIPSALNGQKLSLPLVSQMWMGIAAYAVFLGVISWPLMVKLYLRGLR